MEQFIQELSAYPLLLAAFIILARIIDVSLGTIRTIMVVRGQRRAAAALGFFEVIAWVLGVSGVLSNITLVGVLAYATGFAAGNATGIFIERKLAIGQQLVFMLSRHQSSAVAFALRLAGYRVTEVPATGRDGPVGFCFAVVSRRKVPDVLRLARQADNEVLVFFETVESAKGPLTPMSFQPTGWRAILKKK